MMVILLDWRVRLILLIGIWMMTQRFSLASGHASAELWLSPPVVKQGSPTLIPAAIRMVYEKGWHGYWINPGEGGMKTEVTWKLPEGISVGEVLFPAPKREMTGELACYGYTGEVLLPVLLTVSEKGQGARQVEATVSWLACNEKECAAGEAAIKVDLADAATADPRRALAIRQAFEKLPQTDARLTLDVKEADGWVELMLKGADHLAWDGAQVFPVTEQALDPSKPMVLQKSSDGFKTRVKKNEYSTVALTRLVLVVVPPHGANPIRIEWKK
jgi:thiol:disulfide interchange protein DsbD